MGNMTDWVVDKLAKDQTSVKVVGRTPDDLLVVASANNYTFSVAVLDVQDLVLVPHVQPLFARASRPQLVINVPSKTLWSGAAIDFLHSVPAAFGTMGDITRAANTKAAERFRDKNVGFSSMQCISTKMYRTFRTFLTLSFESTAGARRASPLQLLMHTT